MIRDVVTVHARSRRQRDRREVDVADAELRVGAMAAASGK
jgi:hypothetical protein